MTRYGKTNFNRHALFTCWYGSCGGDKGGAIEFYKACKETFKTLNQGTDMRTFSKLVLAVAFAICALYSEAQARMYMDHGFIVHTRLAPVIVHRIFPPYLGRHVYARNVQVSQQESRAADKPSLQRETSSLHQKKAKAASDASNGASAKEGTKWHRQRSLKD